MLPRSGQADLVVLGDVLRRKILLQCRDQRDPKTALVEWLAYLQDRRNFYMDPVFHEQRSDAHLSIEAVRVSSWFDQFAAHLAEAFTKPAS